MIHEIGVELSAKLKARGCPLPVVDGPERTGTSTGSRERIVIEYDENAGDRFGAVRSQRQNPKHRFTRAQGAKITIYAQSGAAGALEFEHRRRASHVLDLVLVAMDEVAIARTNAWAPTGGKFFTPVDMAMSEVIAGAAYELTFTFDRAVFTQTWAGDVQPQTTLGPDGVSITNTTNVTQANGPDDQSPEVGCGA